MRNLYRYTKIYSGGEPELIEGDIFKTIVPLDLSVTTDKVADKMTSGEKNFIKSLIPYFEKNEWITNAEAREYTGTSEGSVKRFLRNLTEKKVYDFSEFGSNFQKARISSY